MIEPIFELSNNITSVVSKNVDLFKSKTSKKFYRSFGRPSAEQSIDILRPMATSESFGSISHDGGTESKI
ncbi:hypothetical protein C0J52_14420 [Blattella germanica]|nr:hypothetical protein C0J52_14420 [Blattella germanica]